MVTINDFENALEALIFKEYSSLPDNLLAESLNYYYTFLSEGGRDEEEGSLLNKEYLKAYKEKK